jgi:hypothetical protein
LTGRERGCSGIAGLVLTGFVLVITIILSTRRFPATAETTPTLEEQLYGGRG